MGGRHAPKDAPKRLSTTRTSLDSIDNKKPAVSKENSGFLDTLNIQGKILAEAVGFEPTIQV
jgi:hypothetical protein